MEISKDPKAIVQTEGDQGGLRKSALPADLARACSRIHLMSSAVSVVRAGIFKDRTPVCLCVCCRGMWGVFIVLIGSHVLRSDGGRFDRRAAGTGSALNPVNHLSSTVGGLKELKTKTKGQVQCHLTDTPPTLL